MAKRDKDLFDKLRDSGLRKKTAGRIAEAAGGGGNRGKKALQSAVKDLRGVASELEDRAKGGPAKRKATAKKAAADAQAQGRQAQPGREEGGQDPGGEELGEVAPGKRSGPTEGNTLGMGPALGARDQTKGARPPAPSSGSLAYQRISGAPGARNQRGRDRPAQRRAARMRSRAPSAPKTTPKKQLITNSSAWGWGRRSAWAASMTSLVPRIPGGERRPAEKAPARRRARPCRARGPAPIPPSAASAQQHEVHSAPSGRARSR